MTPRDIDLADQPITTKNYTIYNKTDFDKKREAQKWWLYKSLEEFKSELFKYKINLQILAGDELDIFSKINKKRILNSN